MQCSCYDHAMSTLQVRNLPVDLHEKLSERSKRLGVSMSEYVTRVLRDDLARPLLDDWVASQRTDIPLRDIDVAGVLNDVRTEYDPATASREHHP